ncbi:hypothetical protein [Wenxinia marina]|uniref:Wenxma_19, whole genome shotgun sequence n=1 Tax=Wenxinia marina DSM 24838 TaxID=1123501 RepID=A0A0D0PZI3_9RHOB|nr:hypothetical protein [Wenxinia marina]KIQ67754.1 Helix-turn-helix domain protein [Wenxinia marina DSM 24838]GGL77503.1 hypothetical protein GCM10011392_34930 [Wenxinia marina]
MGKANRTGRSKGRYVQLHEWFQRTEAWATMSPGPRALYVEVKRRFNGANNGDLFLSHRDAAKALNVSRNTASRYFAELQERGFLRMTQAHCLGPAGIGQTCKWALEEETTPDGRAATKSFVRWTAKTETPRKN